MTAEAEVFVDVPAPLSHQEAAYYSPARFKVLRCGRRWGKDRVGFTAAVAGHGPVDRNGEPLWRGAAQGGWVVWLVRDFTQGKGIWLEEYQPRFRAAEPEVEINESELRVKLPNGGGILLCTAKNANSIRGLGKDLFGIVGNEAAWLDLENIWLSVVRPILVDNVGWAILMSTSNSGLDGNIQGTTPSFFNRLCMGVRAGERPAPEWAEFTGTGYDNPELPPGEMAKLEAEYAPGSLKLREEVYAELVPAGAGLAFPQWEPTLHLAPWQQIPSYWRFAAGMDWGLRAPAVVVMAAFGPDEDVLWCREWTWSDKDAYEAGYDFATALLTDDELPGWPESLWVDSAMNERTGVGGKTILGEFQTGIDAARAEVVQAPPLLAIPLPKGPGSRRSGYNLMTKALAWGPPLADGTVPPSRRPRHRILKTRDGRTSCPMLAGQLAALPLDPKDNTDVDTEKPDHAYDAARYLVMGWARPGVKPRQDIPADTHPGYLPNGRLRSRHRTPEVERAESQIVYQHAAEKAGQRFGGKYGTRPR